MKSRARSLADKSVDAMLGAVEIYNKPNFSYREESFAILAINAWELLLKARVLQLGNNRMSSILRYERRQKADGSRSEKLYRVKNRSGTFLSVGLFGAIDRLRDEYGDKVHPSVRENLELLCEVRDNAIHFFNKGFDISKLVQELGTACLRNYLVLVRQWFGIDMSSYNFFLMPLAFVREAAEVDAVALNADERKVLDYLRTHSTAGSDGEESDFNVALRLDIKFSKSKDEAAPKVRLSNDPDAMPVSLSEEDIREKYPWDYGILSTRLDKRYDDFLQNGKYHDLRRSLESDERYCRERYLDPGNPRSGVKRFYNPNIVREFDAHYSKKT